MMKSCVLILLVYLSATAYGLSSNDKADGFSQLAELYESMVNVHQRLAVRDQDVIEKSGKIVELAGKLIRKNLKMAEISETLIDDLTRKLEQTDDLSAAQKTDLYSKMGHLTRQLERSRYARALINEQEELYAENKNLSALIEALPEENRRLEQEIDKLNIDSKNLTTKRNCVMVLQQLFGNGRSTKDDTEESQPEVSANDAAAEPSSTATSETTEEPRSEITADEATKEPQPQVSNGETTEQPEAQVSTDEPTNEASEQSQSDRQVSGCGSLWDKFFQKSGNGKLQRIRIVFQVPAKSNNLESIFKGTPDDTARTGDVFKFAPSNPLETLFSKIRQELSRKRMEMV